MTQAQVMRDHEKRGEGKEGRATAPHHDMVGYVYNCFVCGRHWIVNIIEKLRIFPILLQM